MLVPELMASTRVISRGGRVMDALIMSPYGVQAVQVLTILLGAPLVSGFISHAEGRIQGRRGPRLLQPYYDIIKLFSKETLVTNESSWVFFAGPIVAFACYLTV